MNLKQALEQNKLMEFIAEYKDSPNADKELLDKLIESTVKTPAALIYNL